MELRHIVLKIILIIIFFFLSFSYFYIKSGLAARPVWSDFCPDGLENAEYKEIQWYWPEGTKSTQAIYNYWAQRRVEFEKGLAECDSLDGGLNNSCYEELRKRQNFVSEQYYKNIHQKQISNQIWRDDHDKGSRPIMINIFMK